MVLLVAQSVMLFTVSTPFDSVLDMLIVEHCYYMLKGASDLGLCNCKTDSLVTNASLLYIECINCCFNTCVDGLKYISYS